MDINDLFDGIAEAFRQYQAQMADQEQASGDLNPTGLGLKCRSWENREESGYREES